MTAAKTFVRVERQRRDPEEGRRDQPPLASVRARLEPGRLVEFSGASAVACTTAAVAAVLEAQAEGETAAWIQQAPGCLFPPDLAGSGVDLEALVVLHVPASAGFHGLPRAAELLLRSGGFGLVLIDLRDRAPSNETVWQSRLLGLAREHRSRVLLLTGSATRMASLGSLVSLRVEPRRSQTHPGSFTVSYHVLKDKTGCFPRTVTEPRHGPIGY